MEATIIQLLLLSLSTMGVLGLSIIVYIYSTKVEKTWFYSYAMLLIVMVQWMSDVGASLTYHNLFLHLSSIVLFPSVIFCIFAVHILQGAKESKQMLFLLLTGEIGYAAIIGLTFLLGSESSYIQIGIPWLSNHLFSSIALIVDFLLLFLAWPFVHNPSYKLPLWLKIFIISFGVLAIDSLIFTVGTFWGNPVLYQIIKGNIIVRIMISIVMTPIITIYINSIEKQSGATLKYHTWNDFRTNLEQTSILLESKKKVADLEKLEDELQQKNIDLQNQRKAIMNVLDDVQQEKNIVIKQAEELRRFKVATEQSNEMIIFTDSDGIVLWANKATESITGFSVSEAVGKKAGVLWGKIMPKEWYANLWKTVKTDKKMFVSEIENHRKDGNHFWSTITIFPLLDMKGDVQFLVATQRDITREKAIDLMKTDFISLASHQLRTPLSAMKWFLEMLLNGDLGTLSAEQIDAVDNIDQSNERMIDLVNALLNISRIESGRIIVEPIPTNMVTLIEDVAKEIKTKFDEKQQKLTINKDSGIKELMIDPRMMRQVIINLLTNANKYTPNNGNITVTIADQKSEIRIEVKDTGYGIPVDDQKRLFERFFRASNITKIETNGTGLGLYLAKAIIDSSGGKIGFESVEGQGTMFWFTIPVDGMKPRAGEVRLS